MAGPSQHILQVPTGVFILRCIQLATAIAILGLAAYGVTFVTVYDSINLTLFTVSLTHPHNQTQLTPIGYCNNDNHSLCDRLHCPFPHYLQLLGYSRPRHFCHHLLDYLLCYASE
jgi:hypothetical protein